MDKELKLLKSKIRYLEDKNFILETKIKVFESVIKQSFFIVKIFELLFSLVYTFKGDLFKFYEEYFNIPNEIILFVQKSIEEYEIYLDMERKIIFKENNYIPFKIHNYSFSDFNEKILKFRNDFKKIVLNFSNNKNYSSLFLNELAILLFKYNIQTNLTEFVNLFEVTKFIFKLLGTVYTRFPFHISNLNEMNLTNSFESIKTFVENKFETNTILIFDRIKIVPSFEIILNSHVELFLNSLNDKIVFKNTLIELMKQKSFYLEKYTSIIDQRIFNKFTQIMFPFNNHYDKPKLKFNLDDADIVNFSNFLNISFAISNFDSENESLVNNYLLENILLKKFLKCAIEQIGIDGNKIDVINPIKALIKYKNS